MWLGICCFAAVAADLELETLPQQGADAESLRAVLEAVGRGPVAEGEAFHGLLTLLSEYDFRSVAGLALDPSWQGLCEDFARDELGHVAKPIEIVQFATLAVRGDDPAASRLRLRQYFDRRREKKLFVVRGRVTDAATGKGLAGAFIRGAAIAGAFADGEGQYELRTYTTIVDYMYVGAFAAGRIAQKLYRPKANAAAEQVDFALAADRPIHGRILAPAGNRGAPFARAVGYRYDQGNANQIGMMTHISAAADAKGRFVLRGLVRADGQNSQVHYSAYGFEPSCGYAEARGGGAGTEDDPLLLHLAERPLWEGRVLDERGAPVAFADVMAISQQGDRGDVPATTADARGRFRFAPNWSPDGAVWTLVASRPGWSMATVPAPANGTPARLALTQQGAFIEATATFPDGTLAADCLVSNFAAADANATENIALLRRATATNAKGRFRFGPMPSGRKYRFHVATMGSRGYSGEAVAGEPTTIQLNAVR